MCAYSQISLRGPSAKKLVAILRLFIYINCRGTMTNHDALSDVPRFANPGRGRRYVCGGGEITRALD